MVCGLSLGDRVNRKYYASTEQSEHFFFFPLHFLMHWNPSVHSIIYIEFFSPNSESIEVKKSLLKTFLPAEVFAKDKTNIFSLLQELPTDSIYYYYFLGLFTRSQLFAS